MYLNKVYRSDEYCEIPKCDDFKWGCSNIPCGSKYSLEPNHQLINCNSDEKLSCGCPAFEFYSHNNDCEFYNIYESDLRSLSPFAKIPLWNPNIDLSSAKS